MLGVGPRRRKDQQLGDDWGGEQRACSYMGVGSLIEGKELCEVCVSQSCLLEGEPGQIGRPQSMYLLSVENACCPWGLPIRKGLGC